MLRRWKLVAAVAGATLFVPAPALADPPVPTNYRSTIVAVPAGIEARIVGGDSFLAIEVPAGTEAAVPGYSDEPYLRVLADGTVERNRRSEATWLNETRYGLSSPDLSTGADNDAPPLWEVVATGGGYAWHDHRIHWMGLEVPRHVDVSSGEQLVNDWSIPITVDGQQVAIEGRLTWRPDVSPALPLLVTIVAVAGVIAVAVRRRIAGALAGAITAGVAAGIGGGLLGLGLPAGATANPLDLALPALAIVAAVLAAAASRSRPLGAALLTGLAAAPAIVWAIVRLGAYQRPVLPAEPAGLLRVTVAVAIGAGLGAIAAGLWAFLTAGVEDLDGSQ